MQPTSVPERLTENQLERYLTKIIEQIQKELKISITPEKKKALACHIAKIMMKNGDFPRENAIDKNSEFRKKLTLALVMTAKLDKHDDLFEKLENLFKDKTNIKDEDLKEALKNKLSVAELKELKLMMEKIREIYKDLEKINFIKPPTPAPGAPKEEMDPNTVLLGLINTKQSGSMQSIVTCINFPSIYIDQNPNNGTAPIDQINKIDSQQGDPLGLHHVTKEHFEAILGDVVSEAKAAYLRPTPTLSR